MLWEAEDVEGRGRDSLRMGNKVDPVVEALRLVAWTDMFMAEDGFRMSGGDSGARVVVTVRGAPLEVSWARGVLDLRV